MHVCGFKSSSQRTPVEQTMMIPRSVIPGTVTMLSFGRCQQPSHVSGEGTEQNNHINPRGSKYPICKDSGPKQH